MTKDVQIKRVYEAPDKNDGIRVLIDRLWPRGLKREDAALDAWMKDAAPTNELRKWFNHDPEKWAEFQRRYEAELRANEEAVRAISEKAGKSRLTLLYSAHDEKHNNAVVLARLIRKMH